MSFYQNGILISGVNTLPELTRAQYEALPVDKRPEYWVCLDEEYEPASSGHTIEDTDANVMPQEDNLQFVGLEVTDDSANGKTIVDATDKVTWEANGFLGAKNIMPYPYTRMSTVVRGITWGDNGDGGIVANGTGTEASSQPYCELYGVETNNTKSLLLKANTWYALTCKRTSPYALGANIYFLNPTTMLRKVLTYDVIWGDTSQTQVTASNVYMFYNNVVYDEVKFRLPEDVYAQVQVRYRGGTDVTVVNDVQYPMICRAEDTDRTYQLYAMTNRELTVGKASQAEVDDILNVYGAKQMIEYPYQESSVTRDGITYTDNGDGTITANGTATANANFYIGTLKPIKKGTYTLTNGLNNSPTTYKMRIRLTTDHGTTYSSVDLNNEKVTFTVEQDCEYNIYLWVVSGVTVSNVTFKPLLTPASVTNRTFEPYAMTNKQLTDNKANKTDIATVESGTTASRAYSVGELVYVSGTLYRVKTAIASGATFTVGTNIEVTNVSNSVAKAVRKPIAVFTLATGQISLNNTQMETINGNWSIEDASVYSVSGNGVTLLKDGVYLIELNMHGLVIPQSYIQVAANISTIGNVATGQTINGLDASALQGFSSSSYLRRLSAGGTITLIGYSSSTSNYLYGSDQSSTNRITVIKLE